MVAEVAVGLLMSNTSCAFPAPSKSHREKWSIVEVEPYNAVESVSVHEIVEPTIEGVFTV
jgi:hypothetical protein